MQSMGGGWVMRAAAKVAGIRVVNGGLRGVPAAAPAEHTAARPASAIVSSSEELKSNVLTSLQNNAIDAGAVHRPYWEIDDWEFDGAQEEVVVKSGEPMPRLVFFGGAPPTLQEAKEATSELKDALEKAYLTSANSIECGDLLIPGHQCPFSLVSKPDYSETKSYFTSETAAASVPKNALNAFKFLSESTAAQTVVASIASDPNVWNAVLHNEALTEFLESQKSNAGESVSHKEFRDEQSASDETSGSKKSADSGNSFMHIIKTTVNKITSSLSDCFQQLFGSPTEEKDSGDADGNAKSTFKDMAMGASVVMGLAVMVIILVVLKRG